MISKPWVPSPKIFSNKNHIHYEGTYILQPNNTKITRLERIALLFIKAQISTEPGYGIIFKRFRGKMYVLEEWKVQ